MSQRPWWNEIVDEGTAKAANFVWKPTSDGMDFTRLSNNYWNRCYNHFEFHSLISLKDELYRTLRIYCKVYCL